DVEYEVEVRDGPVSTHTLREEDLIHSSDELRDENSVIFRVADLKPKAQPKPQGTPAGRVTRQAELKDIGPPSKIPSVPKKPATPPQGSKRAPTAAMGSRPSASSAPPAAPQPVPQRAPTSRPRLPNEETREVGPAPPGAEGDSGLLSLKTPPPPVRPTWADAEETHPGELENI